MQALVLHPNEKRHARHRVRASIRRVASSDVVTLRFEVESAVQIEWGAGSEQPMRVDGLWKSTCFECFAGQNSSSYDEWNFSPSGDWAAYHFESYREGMSHLEVSAPTITRTLIGDRARFEIDFAWPEALKKGAVAFSLTAVILEKGDASPFYWALVHAGSKPDFHLRESFILELEC